MAFVKAKIDLGNPLVGTGLKVSLKRTNKSSARLTMILSSAAALQCGWEDSAKLEVLIGEGEHHGLVRLRKNASVGEATVQRRETAKGAWFGVRLGHQPAFVDRSESARWCQFEAVEDGWVEVVLPKWADETAPNKSKPAAPAPAQKPALAPSAPPNGRNVTAAVMGDPPPGRRQMLEKIGSVKA